MEQKLGRYVVQEQLGEGSFAYVYRAFDPELERHVALKVLKPAWLSDSAVVARFKQEARTMARLDKNPHIAVVYEVGEDKGQVYLAQLLVDGETLAARLARGPLAWPAVLDILSSIASALDYAHSQGVIHRDIKPSNILLDKEGRAYLGDFGLVRAAEGSVSLSASIVGVKGTAAYIAPEVWNAEEPTQAADVYALSCVVFEMLTGAVLFEGSSIMAVMRKHDQGPQFPDRWPEGVPAGVTEVLQRGLAANPAERIQSAGELSAALVRLSAPPQPIPSIDTPIEIDDEVPTEPRLSRETVSLWLVSSATPAGTGGQSFKLKPGSLTLGRSTACDIRVDDALASRHHATLEFDGQRCTVYDEDSANGTFINEKPVPPGGQPFEIGDRLKIGDTYFSLSTQPAPARVVPPSKPVDAVREQPQPAPKRRSSGLMVGLVGCGSLLALIVCGMLVYNFWPQPPPVAKIPTSTFTSTPIPTQTTPTSTVPSEPTKQEPPTPTSESSESTPTPTPYTRFIGGDCSHGGLLNSIEALDDLTVKFTLCSPDVSFPQKVAFPAFNIHPSEYLESTGGTGAILEKPIGTGPYQMVDWQHGDSIVLKRFDDYWGEPAKTETLIFRWSPDQTQRLLGLLAGEVDGFDNPAPNDFGTIQGDGNLVLYPREGLNVFYLGMNNYYPPFDDQRVRQAIAVAIDQQRIVDNFYPVVGSVASYFTPCGVPGGCAGTAWPSYDPERAKALLAEAGYPDGFATTITYRDVARSYLPDPGVVAQDIQSQLQEIGIETEIVVMGSGDFFDTLDNGELTGFHLLGWIADYPDPSNFLDPHFGVDAGNQFGEGFAELHDVLKLATSVVDQTERNEWYAKANELLVEYVPMVPIAHSGSATVFGAWVQGAHASPLDNEYFAAMEVSGRDTLVWMQSAEPLSAYCADEVDSGTFRLCQQVSESLLAYQVGGMTIRPNLAERYEVNDDLTEWTFYLRPGVKFHNGSELDARDVMTSYEAQWDTTSPLHTGREGVFEYFNSFFGLRVQ